MYILLVKPSSKVQTLHGSKFVEACYQILPRELRVPRLASSSCSSLGRCFGLCSAFGLWGGCVHLDMLRGLFVHSVCVIHLDHMGLEFSFGSIHSNRGLQGNPRSRSMYSMCCYSDLKFGHNDIPSLQRGSSFPNCNRLAFHAANQRCR